jgi:hypothetical protein
MGGYADFMSFYLELYIWPDAICDVFDKGTTSNCVQILE